MTSPWLTREKAADYYGVSIPTIARWLADGVLNGATLRVGQTVRIHLERADRRRGTNDGWSVDRLANVIKIWNLGPLPGLGPIPGKRQLRLVLDGKNDRVEPVQAT